MRSYFVAKDVLRKDQNLHFVKAMQVSANQEVGASCDPPVLGDEKSGWSLVCVMLVSHLMQTVTYGRRGRLAKQA